MFLSGFSPILLLVITLIDSVVYGLYSTYYIRKYIKAESGYYLKNAVVCAFVCLIICAVEKFSFALSALTIVLGLLFGIATMAQGIVNSKAINIGPWSYTTVIANFSTVITAISGYLIFSDPAPSVWKYIGIAFMFAYGNVRQLQKSIRRQTQRKVVCVVGCVDAVIRVGGTSPKVASKHERKRRTYGLFDDCFCVFDGFVVRDLLHLQE